MRKAFVIMQKEFDEIMKNRMILISLIAMPLLFAIIIPLLLIVPVLVFPGSGYSQNETQGFIKNVPGAEGMTEQQALVVFFVTATLPFFMVMPAILPTIISSYSIIGEKKNRTLEPLLAAPVSVYDVIVGKTLSALIPSMIVTWISAVVYAVLVFIITYPVIHRVLIPDLSWAIGLLVLAPLLAFMGIMATIIVSAKVNDPRTAQQISVLFILPLIGIFIAQMSGLMLINAMIMVALCVIALAADALVLRIGKEMFDREGILTHWK